MNLLLRCDLFRSLLMLAGLLAVCVSGCGGGATSGGGIGGGGTGDGGGGISGTPFLDQYKKDMQDINSQFKIGRTEVTVGMWKEYCSKTGSPMPAFYVEGGPKVIVDSHPIGDVSWNDCKAYADWAGLRLPTGTEWELAASGGDGRNYPWGGYGNQLPDSSWPGWDPFNCINFRRGDRSVAPVGSVPADKSPFGCYDMAGNVTEWCSNDNVNKKEIRGGFVSSLDALSPVDFRCATIERGSPDQHASVLGFRLAGPI